MSQGFEGEPVLVLDDYDKGVLQRGYELAEQIDAEMPVWGDMDWEAGKIREGDASRKPASPPIDDDALEATEFPESSRAGFETPAQRGADLSERADPQT